MSDDLIDDLTLKDIETMVAVLERFLRTSQRVERVLRRYAKTRTGGAVNPLRPESVIDYILKRQAEAKAGELEEEEEGLTKEETKQIIEKIRKGEAKEVK